MTNSVLAHFVGGPADGQTWQIQAAPPELNMHAPSAPCAAVLDAEALDQPLPVTKVVYRRRPGVVANEVVYEWQP